ncbi:DUF1573 domain-containing protein [Mucilaginibacter sp. L3T2-6]|uniref:DUF1573 domain-containing protein n=1 Tax=Mucilaginibacter sp. L3T2-6 TaxID=3062491 RepID=UPI002674D223|nr:DUF1573 domain-containing protein [Mucilaginibacter sp. L3T2-6]MDO3641302.1 DUF1573 domain-containing protein [Mucilaginibacter sp. L3T2-6]MDV6213938.1 DUF1573 domain-containing protein [Mucilaginibacter sp. L3T2-6]
MNTKKLSNTIILSAIGLGILFIGYLTLYPRADSSFSLRQIFPGSSAEISFEREKYDFGTIPDGSQVLYYFKFKNSGKTPLIIYNASSTCGCTIPKWPSKPILPGRTDSIAVLFKSHGNLGYTDKIITIESNATTAKKTLLFQGSVIKIYKRNKTVI